MSKPPFSPSALESALPVPVIGPWIARLGYAADLFVQPCTPTITAWYYGEFAAGSRIVASLYKPFNLAEIFHALKGGFRRHGLRRLLAGGHSGRGMGVINALEEFAPAKQFAKTRGWNYVVIAGDLAVKAEWYLFVVDVTTDGLINWISQAYQFAGCTSEAGGWAEGHCENVQMLGIDPDIGFDWTTSLDVIAFGPTVLTPAGELRCSMSLSWTNSPGLPPPTFVVPHFIIDGEDRLPHYRYEFDQNTGIGDTVAHITTRSSAIGGHTIRCQLSWDGWLLVTKGMCQISSSPDNKTNLNPDP